LDLDKCEELGVKGHFIWYQSKLLNEAMWQCMGDIDKAKTNHQGNMFKELVKAKDQVHIPIGMNRDCIG
jgi:hypothetical protein